MAVTPDTTTSEDGLLQTCPWCGYLLRGLPIEHRCPECGEAFDRRWRVFECGALVRHYNLRHWIFFFLDLGLPIVTWAATEFYGDELFGRFPWFTYVVPLGFLASGIPAMIEFRRRYPAFCAVGPIGVTVGQRGDHASDQYPWSHIKQAELSGGVRMTLRDGRQVTLNARTGREADRCADYISDILEYGYPPPP